MRLRISSARILPAAVSRAGGFAALAILLAAGAQALLGGPTPPVRHGQVSGWTQHHILYPAPRGKTRARIPAPVAAPAKPGVASEPFLRHHESWNLGRHRGSVSKQFSDRDWSLSLGAGAFQPVFDMTFDIAPEVATASLNAVDQGNGSFLATSGTLIVTAGNDIGTYPLVLGGPGVTTSPQGGFIFDDLITPQANPPLDVDGLVFSAGGVEINIWGNSPNNYSFYDYSGGAYGTQLTGTGTITSIVAPSAGQSFPAKYAFDVTAAPSCTNDYVVMGVAANPASGGQANIVGVNNLYSTQGASVPAPFCGITGPSVMFAYASGSGQVPNFVTISQDGTQLAYIETLSTGSSLFHVLTIGTTGSNGTSASAAAVPGAGNNAVDQTVLLSPDGGTTNQSSTNAPFVAYTPGDTNDVAYATTYSQAGGGSGYLYKINNVFNPGQTPAIVWSVAINAVPSTPIFDSETNQIFFTDSQGRIDYVTDMGATPSAVTYSAVLASGATSVNPLTLDMTNQMVYACFNSDGTNALVVQAPVDLSSSVSIPVGAAGTTYGAPYGVQFNNAFYTGSGTPVMYVAGTGTGSLPTLYGVGFTGGGALNPADVTSAALATGAADSSPVTEFFNSNLGADLLFVGVTNNCIATTNGGNAGCVISLDITAGFPTINAGSVALAATGGTSGIIVDNNSGLTQASSIYYATKTGNTLIKATQSGLN